MFDLGTHSPLMGDALWSFCHIAGLWAPLQNCFTVLHPCVISWPKHLAASRQHREDDYCSQRCNDDHNFAAPGLSLHRGFGRIIDKCTRRQYRRLCLWKDILGVCVNFSKIFRYWRLSSCRLCDSVKPIFTDKAETG